MLEVPVLLGKILFFLFFENLLGERLPRGLPIETPRKF